MTRPEDDTFRECDIPDPPPRPALTPLTARVVMVLAFSDLPDAAELANHVAQTSTGGNPRRVDRDAARAVYVRVLRESGKVEAAVAAVAAEFGCTRKHVFEMKRAERWPGKQ